MAASNGGEWQVAGRRKARRSTPRATVGRARQSSGEISMDDEKRAEPENVSEAKRLAVESRVRRLADALRGSPLVQQAIEAIWGYFQRDEAAGALQSELQVVGYGIGSFCSSSNATHQLALLVAMLEELELLAGGEKAEKKPAEVFDPVMNESDALIAEHFGINVIEANECGRRRADGRTVFFMPHCGKSLYENVVASNWGASIADVLIIGNSFEAYGDRILDSTEREKLLLLQALPFVKDERLPIGVDKGHEDFSRFESAFNDLSVITFTNIDALVEDRELAERMANATSGGERDEVITA